MRWLQWDIYKIVEVNNTGEIVEIAKFNGADVLAQVVTPPLSAQGAHA